MSIITKYHRLFEVRILHEFFLLEEDKLSFFDLSKEDQLTQLEKRISFGHYQLMNDLNIEPDIKTKKHLKNLRLKFIQTTTGMTLACGSMVQRMDGIDYTVPEIALTSGGPASSSIELNFLVRLKKSAFFNYTAVPLNSKRTGGYIFSNITSTVESPDYISLSQPIPSFNAGETYLSGDIADHSGNLKEAFAHTSTPEFWEEVKGTGFVNENDRRVFAKRFTYYPQSSELNDPITFSLKAIDSSETLKEISVSQPSKTGVNVDFRMILPNRKTESVPLEDGRYQLEISSANGTRQKEIFLSDAFQNSDLGIINIRIQGEGVRKFLGDKGEILTPHPIYEIRFRSRKSFWRYQARQNGKKLEPVGSSQFFKGENFQDAQDSIPSKLLVTRTPQKIARMPVQITDEVGTKDTFPQPNPSPLKMKVTEELSPNEPPGRIFSDLYISTIEGKIKVV